MAGREVLIVGAGPTGLTAALLLAGYGVASTVVERRADPHPLPRAVHLDDGAVRILQQVGLAEEFAAISRPAAGLRLLDARGRPFAQFAHDDRLDRRRADARSPDDPLGPDGRSSRDRGEHGHPASNLFDQPALDGLLRAAVARCPLVTLRSGVEVTGVAQSATGVVATARAPAPHVELAAACVLGCDGAGSAVRAAIGAQLRDLRFTQRWFVLDVRARRPLPVWGGVDQLCDPRRAATFLPLPGDRYRFEFRMHPGETLDELARPERLASLTAPWRAGIPVADLDVVRAAEYTFRARVADRWRDGRVLLLGDAAHLTPPFIGQGLGLGLRDAHNLAWKLAAVLGAGPPGGCGSPRGAGGPGDRMADAVLDSYQAERAPHAEAVIRGAVLVGRAMTGGSGVAAALRRPLAGVLLRVPAVRVRARRGIVARYPAGPLVDRRRHRRDLVGTACPQPVVRAAGRDVLLDDVLGAGWALLAAGPVPPRLRARARRVDALTIELGPVASAEDRGARTVPVDPASDIGDRDARTVRLDPAADIGDRDALRAWLHGGRTAAVLLRPDRVVAATA